MPLAPAASYAPAHLADRIRSQQQAMGARGADLHWIDSETQGFLDGLVESIGSAKARRELAEICGGFTEGHELADLRDAREMPSALPADFASRQNSP